MTLIMDNVKNFGYGVIFLNHQKIFTNYYYFSCFIYFCRRWWEK